MTKGTVFFQGPSQGNILDQRMFPLRNNKGRASGTGTASNVRREAFKKKGLERENKNMGEEDKLPKEVNWEVEKTRNTKARKLSPEEVAGMMKPKEPQVKKEEVKKEGKGAVSLDKRENKRTDCGKSPSQMDEDEDGGPKKKGKGGAKSSSQVDHEGEIPKGKGKGNGKGQGKKGPKKGKERREKVMAVTLLLTKGKCHKQMTPRAPHLTKVR